MYEMRPIINGSISFGEVAPSEYPPHGDLIGSIHIEGVVPEGVPTIDIFGMVRIQGAVPAEGARNINGINIQGNCQVIEGALFIGGQYELRTDPGTGVCPTCKRPLDA